MITSVNRSFPDVRVRPGTTDQAILESVLGGEYPLPDRFNSDDLVIDVGMHIGSFCMAALTRGSERVHGFEPDPGCFALARVNLAPWTGRVHLHREAVWRSDRPAGMIGFSHHGDDNTGSGSATWGPRDLMVRAVPLDDTIRGLVDPARPRVRLLKIDCEGSEFPILCSCRTLNLIDEIVGEFHELGGDYDRHPLPDDLRVPGFDRYTIAELDGVLRAAGFVVTSSRTGETNMGRFHAVRPPQPYLIVRSDVRLADVGNGISVGDRDACNRRSAGFERTIHIHRSDVSEHQRCKLVAAGGPVAGMVLDYREGAPIPRPDEVANYARRPGSLLVHCAAGACRGPTVAVLCKVARGCDPFTAAADVMRGCSTSYDQAAWIHPIPLDQIIQWWRRQD